MAQGSQGSVHTVKFNLFQEFQMAMKLMEVLGSAVTGVLSGESETFTTPTEQVGSIQGKPIKVSLTVSVGE